MGTEKQKTDRQRVSFVFPVASALIGVSVLLLTLAWAYAFTRIYTRPVTRVAATTWIYQNIPAPINLHIQTGDNAVYQQPLSFQTGGQVSSQNPYVLPFTANASGPVREIYFPHVADSP